MNHILGSLGVLTGSPQQTRLVTPYADGTKALSAFLASAQKKMRTMIYAATLPIFFDNLIAAKSRGVDVKVIFDHSQSAGAAEQPQIEKLIAAGWKDGVDFVIGTSPQSHQIVHIKATWIDDRWVEDGSFNYTPSAFQQINTITFSDWPEYATYLDSIFQKSWSWIMANEPQYQLGTNETQI